MRRALAPNLHVLFSMAALAALAPLSMEAQTISVPEEQLENLQQEAEDIRDMAVPEIDFSNPAGMVETIEEFAASDMVEDMGLGWKRDVVWEMEISGSWGETISGEGEIVHWRLNEPGAVINAQLHDEGREAPLIVGLVAEKALGTHREGGASDVGIGTIDNHFFESERVPGHLRDAERMQTPGFAALDDMVDEFDQTLFRNSRIDVLQAGETDDGSETWHIRWTATLEEEDQFGNPTGRVANVRGWLCDTSSYEDDPEECERDPFDLVELLPSDERGNVNPETPGIEVRFTEPADMESLSADPDTPASSTFQVYTQDTAGTRLTVDGEWEELDDAHYRFVPDDDLHAGVTYRLLLRGGEEPAPAIEARDSDERLEEDIEQTFSTLINLSEQPPADGDPLELDTYQTVKNPALVSDKPAMTRIRVDWVPHDDIHPEWQPDSFEMEMDLAPHHERIVAQGGDEEFYGRVADIMPQDAFDEDDLREARHTINAFGWRPSTDQDRIEAQLRPYDPYPAPLEEAEEEVSRELRHWMHDPGTLRMHYIIADVGDWESPYFESTSVLSPGAVTAIKTWLRLEDGVPQDMIDRAHQVLALTEAYIPQFLPHREAEAVATGVTADEFSMFLAALRDPVSGLRALRDRLGGLGDISISELLDPVRSLRSLDEQDELANRELIAAYMRWMQRLMDDDIRQEDIVVMLVPEGTLGEGTVGLDLSTEFGDVYQGMLAQRARSVVIEIGDSFDADQLALTLVHEIAHTFGLDHNPGHSGDVPPVAGYKDEEIEGFRLDHTGLDGYNKSAEEGNAEAPGTLVSIMWPGINPSRIAMTTRDEYRQLKQAIFSGFDP